MKNLISTLMVGALLVTGSASFAANRMAPTQMKTAAKLAAKKTNPVLRGAKKGAGWYNGSFQTTGWHNSISAGSNGYIQTPGYFQAR